MEKFAPRTRLLDYKCYSYYKSREKIADKDRVTSQKEFFTIVKKIWEVTARHLVEKEGGVVLDRFGYLCHWMTPKKKVFKMPKKGGYKIMANYHTDRHWYNTTLFSNIFNYDYFKGWSLDRAFNNNIKKGRYKKLLNGMKYKFYYTLVRSLYTNRFNQEKYD